MYPSLGNGRFEIALGLLGAEVPIRSPSPTFLHLLVQNFKFLGKRLWLPYMGVKTQPVRVCVSYTSQEGAITVSRIHCIPSFPSLCSSFLSLYRHLQHNAGTDPPYLCEIRSAMTTLTEGQIQENSTQSHKTGEIKSRGGVKRLKPGEPDRVPMLQSLK